MEIMNELKSCPFCGQYPDKMTYSFELENEHSIQTLKIMCRCGTVFSQTYIEKGLNELSMGGKLNVRNPFDVWNNRNPKYYAQEIVNLNTINYEELFKTDEGKKSE